MRFERAKGLSRDGESAIFSALAANEGDSRRLVTVGGRYGRRGGG
jgi:hypothetical protein